VINVLIAVYWVQIPRTPRDTQRQSTLIEDVVVVVVVLVVVVAVAAVVVAVVHTHRRVSSITSPAAGRNSNPNGNADLQCYKVTHHRWVIP